MKNLQKFVFLMSCILTLKKSNGKEGKLLKLIETAENTGIKSKTVDSYESLVLVDNQSYGIYMKDVHGPSEFGYNSSTLSKLYVCVNCEISKWIKQKLFELIEQIPLYYKSIFYQEHYDVFIENIKSSSTTLDDIVSHNTRFVNLLLTFINIYLSENDTSNDTHVLETLISLSFEINYLKGQLFVQTVRNKNSDVIIVRIMLGALNSIRQFMLLNCDQYFYFKNNQLHVISAHNHGNEETNIDTFLDKIRPLNLEVHNSCDVHQMTLVNAVAQYFDHVEWTTTKGVVKVVRIMQKIKKVRGLGKVFWYQKYMFNTIMKLLFTKILNHFEESKFLSEITVTQIQNMYSNVLEDNILILPSHLVNCFSLLLSKKQHVYSENDDLLIAIQTYLKSVEHINLETEKHKEDSTNKTFDGINEENVKDLSIRSLESYIFYLNVISEDLRCFIRLYEFLHSINVTEIGPSVQILDVIKAFNQEFTINFNERRTKRLIDTGCQFFPDLQQYFINVLMYINMTQYENSDDNFFFDAKSILHAMLKYLNNFHDGYLPHIKVADSVALAIEFIVQDNTCCDHMNRLLLLVMTELDNYSIEFCNPPDFNFLSFNNINFELNGLINTKIADILLKSMTTVQRITGFKYQFLYSRIRDLDKKFSNLAETFRFYDKITLMWKGRNMDIGDIRYNLMRNPVSSSAIYKVYGVFFKFALAFMYYEMYKYNELFPGTNKSKLNIPTAILNNEIPLYFNGIIQAIILPLLTGRLLPQIATSISSLFEKMGIHIDFGPLEGDSSAVESVEEYHWKSQNRINKILLFIQMIHDNLVKNALYNHVRFERTEDVIR